jgi:hypothetical protein
MTYAVTVSPFVRDSRDADVEHPGHRSPFRSRSSNVVDIATEQMIGKRLVEINAIEDALKESMPRVRRNLLRTRLTALVNSLESWEAYDRGRESRAVVIP